MTMGPKELQVRALRAARAEKKPPKPARLKTLRAVVALAKPLPVSPAKQETVMEALENTAPAVGGDADAPAPKKDRGFKVAKKPKMKPKAKGKKAAPKRPAKKAGKAAKAKKPTDGGVRPGSKLEAVVGLLRRSQGCTTADVLKATGWPSVSMPQMAKASGLKLAKEKDGKVTRYRAA